MTDPLAFERDADPGYLQAHDTGWQVPGLGVISLPDDVAIDGDGVVFTITFADGRPAIIGDAAQLASTIRSLTNTDQEVTIMPSKQANHIDEAADDATGIIEKYANPAMTFIGQEGGSASEVLRKRRNWNDLSRSEVIKRVTLDLTPEVKGRPQPMRPGVEQIVFMALPEWHALFKAGHQEAVALLYRPSTTWEADEIVNGRPGKKRLASGNDASGWIGIVDYFGSLEAAEVEAAELQQAVRDHTRSDLTDADLSEHDPVAGVFGKRDAWV